MTNIHRLPPVPKLRRRGVVRCYLSDDLTHRDLMALEHIGLIAINRHGVLHIEHKREQNGRV